MKILNRIIIVIVLLAFCGMVVNGCGNKMVGSTEASKNAVEETTEQDATEQDAIEKDATAKEATVNGAIGKEATVNGAIEKENENIASEQLSFVYQGNKIAISDIVDDQKIESMLGKADETKSHTYSQDDGLNMDQLNGRTEKKYKFPGLVIKTINAAEDNKYFIFSIEITDPKYPTIRDVIVGDTFEKLKEAYPEGNLLGGELSEEEDDFRYEPVDYVDVLNFHIKDKKIESILMYKLID